MTVAKAKIRADELVLKLGLSENRSKAQALIMAGEVEFRVKDGDWKKVEKAGLGLKEAEVEVRLTRTGPQDVGRGAQKLRSALELWPEAVAHAKVALDIGSSTGGFTQVLLEHGLQKVAALDVGTHQLHERLRQDPRVLSLEQRHVLKTQDSDWKGLGIDLPFDIIVTDLSFISVTKVIEHAAPWLRSDGSWIVLLKPQFELGPAKAPRGIVRNPEFHIEAIEILKKSVSQGKSLSWKAIAPSPILGGDGNKEFLVWLKRN